MISTVCRKNWVKIRTWDKKMTAHAPTVKSSIHSASNVCEYAKVIAYLKKVPIKPDKQVGVCLRWLTGGFHERIYTIQC